MRRYIVILFLLFDSAFAQKIPAILLNQVTEENGLSNNNVQCVLKDSRGFLWVGTADGLNLIDGSAIYVFRHDETDSNSLSYNDVLSICEDHHKNILIATSTGVSCFQNEAKKFVNAGLPHSVYGASNIVNTIIADRQNRVWCATDGGLFLYNPQTKIFTPYYNTTTGVKLNAVNKIGKAMMDRTGGAIWLCTFEGLWLFDTNGLKFTRVVSKSNDAHYEDLTTTVFEDGENLIWFGNWSAGLKLLDKTTFKVTSFATLPGAISHVTGINEIKLPGGRNVICLNGSLNCFDVTTKKFFQLPKPSGLSVYPLIKSFYQSSDGWMWMCSDKGLWIYNPQRQFFQHHFFSRAITSQSINLMDWNGALLIGGEGNEFLAAYDDDYRVINKFPDVIKIVSYNSISNSTASSLSFIKESENSLLVTNSNGILRHNFKTGSSQWFSHNSNDINSLPLNFVQHLFIDSKNQYWVFPWRSGIYSMNPLTGACHLVYKGFPEGDQTKGLVIADAAEDAQGNLWMADLDEGIVLFDRKNNQFSRPFEKLIGVRARSARIIFRNGFCFAFADDRLLIWNTKTRALQIFKPPAQMRSHIYDMVLDSKNNCWLATKKGLLFYTDSTHGFKQFTDADGLLNNDMDGNLYARDNGKIIFATSTELTEFTPQDLLQSTAISANVLLTSVEANGERINSDSVQSISLNYRQNNLVFHWAVTDYSAPFHNQYWCSLQGIDGDWKYVGNKGEIQYANLSPGTYSLLLKAATANGIAIDKIITVHFKITPPFWKTMWFWAIWIVLAMLIVYWFVNRRIKTIKAKGAIAQQITELELKALKAQMNPHFIFNSLSSIQESIVNGKTDAASKYLGKFSRLIRAVLENSDKKVITLPQELDYLKLYLELESFRFDDFSYTLSNSDIDDPSFVKLPPMLVQPYLENAIKHGLSHKEGSKELKVLFKQIETDLLEVIIEDNGIGRTQAGIINESRTQGHRSMGMKITEDRLNLQRSPKRHRVEIVDMINEAGKAAGTRVTIYIAI